MCLVERRGAVLWLLHFPPTSTKSGLEVLVCGAVLLVTAGITVVRALRVEKTEVWSRCESVKGSRCEVTSDLVVERCVALGVEGAEMCTTRRERNDSSIGTLRSV